MDHRPTALLVDADDAHAAAEELHFDRGAVIDSGYPTRGWQQPWCHLPGLQKGHPAAALLWVA